MDFQDRLQLKTEGGRRWLFDPIRRKWVVLQPEEMVRQLLIHFLIESKGYKKNRVTVERAIEVNGLSKRCDILVYDNDMAPFMLIECKAPQVTVNQAVFRQIATYNLPLRVPYLLVSNGPTSFCCKMLYDTEDYVFLNEIPEFGT